MVWQFLSRVSSHSVQGGGPMRAKALEKSRLWQQSQQPHFMIDAPSRGYRSGIDHKRDGTCDRTSPCCQSRRHTRYRRLIVPARPAKPDAPSRAAWSQAGVKNSIRQVRTAYAHAVAKCRVPSRHVKAIDRTTQRSGDNRTRRCVWSAWKKMENFFVMKNLRYVLADHRNSVVSVSANECLFRARLR